MKKHNQALSLALIVAGCRLFAAVAFTSPPTCIGTSCASPTTTVTTFNHPPAGCYTYVGRNNNNACHEINCDKNADVHPVADVNRRNALQKLSLALVASPTLFLTLTSNARSAQAASGDLFRPNPLTNPLLEQVRRHACVRDAIMLRQRQLCCKLDFLLMKV